jgi:EamA domain-containing membrane protein RarD
MTTRQLIQLADGHLPAMLAIFAFPPVAAWLCGWMHGRDNGGRAPWKYFYSVLVYLSCIPGLFSSVLTAYGFFVSKENMLDVSLGVYFLPIISMIVTLILIRKNVAFDLVPGFNRLEGLMVMIGCSFALALAIEKTRIWIFFGGSIAWLFLLAGGIFALLKWGTYMLFRRRDEPARSRPEFPTGK